MSTAVSSSDPYRYPPVSQTKDSVVPVRFYQPSVNINLQNIDFISEPSVPDDPSSNLLVITRSASNHFQRRDAIRLTWGNASEYTQDYRVTVIYLVGRSSDLATHNLLLAEAATHKDILYADYQDTYTNLTIKDIVAYQYAFKYKERIQYLAIAGDEIVVDIKGVLGLLTSPVENGRSSRDLVENSRKQVPFCYEFPCCTPVVREESSKYLVQAGYYEGTMYPPYCSGTFFVLPMTLVGEVFYMMLDTPYFMPDDAWLGIVYEKLRIPIVDTHMYYAGITSFKRELRLLQHTQSGLFYKKEIMVFVLDYAYKHEDVHTKLIQVWSAFKSQQRLHNNSSNVHYSVTVKPLICIVFLVVLVLCTGSLLRRWFFYQLFISMGKITPEYTTQ